jgi:sec-independent protein translocase protein TatA
MLGFIPKIGWQELVLLLVVVLIIFGPGKLPSVGRAIGDGLRNFKKAANNDEEKVENQVKLPDSQAQTLESLEKQPEKEKNETKQG